MENKFIVIEGIDCSGKTTLVNLLSKNLLQNGYEPVILEEFGTLIGKFFFETVVENNLGIQIPAQVLIRAAGQISELLEKKEAFKSQNTVFLADRYIDSNVIYQTVEYMAKTKNKIIDKKAFQEWARNIYGPFYIKPSTILILDLPVDAAIKRAINNDEPIKPESFLISARQEFLQLANENPILYRVVDATKPPNQVFLDTIKHLKDTLSI